MNTAGIRRRTLMATAGTGILSAVTGCREDSSPSEGNSELPETGRDSQLQLANDFVEALYGNEDGPIRALVDARSGWKHGTAIQAEWNKQITEIESSGYGFLVQMPPITPSDPIRVYSQRTGEQILFLVSSMRKGSPGVFLVDWDKTVSQSQNIENLPYHE